MKIYSIFFLIVLIFQLGCNKADEESQIPAWSKVTALKNQQNWETQAVAFSETTGRISQVSIPVHVNNEFGYLREALYFGNINLRLERQKLLQRIPNSAIDTIHSSYTTLMADGDVVEDRFVVLENEDNFIDIQHLDMDKMEMTGIFQVSFVRDINDPITNPKLPDTIRFTKGEFSLKIVTKN